MSGFRRCAAQMAVVVSERRPVPLFQHVLVGPTLYDLFADVAPTARESAAGGSDVNPALVRVARDESRYVRDDSRRPRGKGGGGRRTVSYGSGAYGGAAHRSRTDGSGHRPTLAAQSRPARNRRTAGPGGPAAGDHVHLLPGRLRGGGAPDARVGAAADQPGRAAGDRRDHRAAHRRAVRRRPPGVGLRPVRRGDDPRDRRPPRRDAAHLQGVRRGSLRPRADQGGLRHRDARARHQHAGPVGGAGEAGQVQRRDPRRHHPGGVHPADRPGRAARHRRRGPRRGGLAAGAGPARGRRPGLAADLSAAVLVRADLQHGGQPGLQCGPGSGPDPAGAVVRPVPVRPVGGRGGALPGPERRRRSRPAGPRRPAIAATSRRTRGCGPRSPPWRRRRPGNADRPAGRVAADPVDPEAGGHRPGAERPQPGLGGDHRPGHPQRRRSARDPWC